MIKRLLITSAAAIGLATSAMAADLPEPVAEPISPEVYGPTVFNWTGFYGGAAIGGGFGKADTKVAGGSRDVNMNGVLGGLYAGYNYQFTPNFLVGAEGNFLLDGQSGSERVGAVRVKQHAQWLASIRARAGVTFDRFLVYGTGGVAFTDLNTETPGFGGSQSKTKVGWTAGGGLEYGITQNLLARVDYQYMGFGSDTTRSGAGRVNSKFDTSVVTAGIAYKF